MFPFQQPHIRHLIVRRDIMSVSAIEWVSPTEPMSADEISKVLSGPDATHCGLVAEYGGHLIGFMIYRLRDKEISIRRISVAETYRHRGVATSLIAAVRELSKHRRDSMSALVDEYNKPAQLLLKKCGFLWTSTIGGAFHKLGHDRYRMVAPIRQPAPRVQAAAAILGMAR